MIDLAYEKVLNRKNRRRGKKIKKNIDAERWQKEDRKNKRKKKKGRKEMKQKVKVKEVDDGNNETKKGKGFAPAVYTHAKMRTEAFDTFLQDSTCKPTNPLNPALSLRVIIIQNIAFIMKLAMS